MPGKLVDDLGLAGDDEWREMGAHERAPVLELHDRLSAG